MKVLLTKDVSGLGRSGDVKEVSDGHARNFLIPKGFALPATSSVLAKVQKEEAERQAKIMRQQEQAQALKNQLNGKTFVIKSKADKTHLFAAIREPQIAAVLNEKMHLELSADQIIIAKPLKSLGLNEVEIRLAPGAQAKVQLDVQAI